MPFFLAHDLDEIAKLSGRTQTQIADELGCAAAALARLGLCRSPSRDARFRADVEIIARRFEIDPNRLAKILREFDAVTGFEPHRGAADGWLAAARDREREPDDQR